MTASYSVFAKKLLADAKAAFGALGDISKVIINATEFTPAQTDSALIAIADNWADVKAFALSRIDGVCTLRVAMREAAV